jgi:hypothetical protein
LSATFLLTSRYLLLDRAPTLNTQIFQFGGRALKLRRTDDKCAVVVGCVDVAKVEIGDGRLGEAQRALVARSCLQFTPAGGTGPPRSISEVLRSA